MMARSVSPYIPRSSVLSAGSGKATAQNDQQFTIMVIHHSNKPFQVKNVKKLVDDHGSTPHNAPRNADEGNAKTYVWLRSSVG